MIGFAKRRISHLALRARLRIKVLREARLVLDALCRERNGVARPMAVPNYLKYNAVSQHWIPLAGNTARLYLERVRPGPCHLASSALSVVPTYDDLVALIEQKYWDGTPASYKWTIYTHGHTMRASGNLDMAKGRT